MSILTCYRCKESPCRCADGATLFQGDCLTVMPDLPEKHFHCCVTSPPYFALRSYLPADHPDKPLEIGSEKSIEAFVATMVEVFRGVKRVLRDDGVLFLNLGDGYTSQGNSVRKRGRCGEHENERKRKPRSKTLGPKQLIGIPWRVALALQADGWWLRDAICWAKPSPMPGSQRDRCTSSYEMVFQLTKKPTYYWDMSAVRERCLPASTERMREGFKASEHRTTNNYGDGYHVSEGYELATRIPRNVWKPEWDEEDARALLDYLNATPEAPNVFTIASEGFPGAHFATFPRALPEKCIKAATSEKGCCPECGTPWVRITDSERVRTRPGRNTKIAVPSGWARGHEPHDSMGLNTPDEKGQRRPAEEIGNRDPGRHVTTTRTIGWRPGCECGGYAVRSVTSKRIERHAWYRAHWQQRVEARFPGPLEPCRVLEPFGGAGTTALAAIGLQRHCTLIELAEDYCEQIVTRLRNGLYSKSAKRKDAKGQQTMFGGE